MCKCRLYMSGRDGAVSSDRARPPGGAGPLDDVNAAPLAVRTCATHMVRMEMRVRCR